MSTRPSAAYAKIAIVLTLPQKLWLFNRNLAAYEAFGAPVWPDTLSEHAGPLAGFLTGLERCETPYLLTVPCDTPWFPTDLAERMAKALSRGVHKVGAAAIQPWDFRKRHGPCP